MARDKSTLRFWLRSDRKNSDGSAPIHLIYSIQGHRKYFQIPNTKLFEINWNSDARRHIYRDKGRAIWVDKKAAKKIDANFDFNLLLSVSEVGAINRKLDKVGDDIRDIEKRFELDGKEFSSEEVIYRLQETLRPRTKKVDLKKSDPGAERIIDFINQFAIICERQEGTKKGYTGLANHMDSFEKYSGKEFTFAGDSSILDDFSNYLITESGINNITRSKLISTFKTLLRFAKKRKKPVNPDYFDFKFESKTQGRQNDLEIIALTEEEFLAIYNLDLSQESIDNFIDSLEKKKIKTNKLTRSSTLLNQARDVFCLSCTTGLRKSDLKQLQRVHIKWDNTIELKSIKGDKTTEIPLNSKSSAILQKYADQERPIPEFNETLNRYIKQLGMMAKIDSTIERVRYKGTQRVTTTNKKYDRLSIHSGRKSFVSMSLAKGMTLAQIMNFTGHTKYEVVKRYLDISKKQKRAAMAETWGEAQGKFKIAN
jgi:integrase